MSAQAWVTLVVGLAATIGVLVTWRQKNTLTADRSGGERPRGTFERSLSQNKLEAELDWRVLTALVASELATKTDSDVIQVIAEHAALGGPGTDEGGPDSSDGEP